MSQVIAEPNAELAVLLLAAGHDEKVLRRHAGFASLRDARVFANRADTKTEVSRAVDARAMRVGIKGLATIEQMLDSESTDGRTRVAAARTALEFAGLLRKGAHLSPIDQYRGLSGQELDALIIQTRAELAEKLAKFSSQPATIDGSRATVVEEAFNAR
jgi:hypothetical protein